MQKMKHDNNHCGYKLEILIRFVTVHNFDKLFNRIFPIILKFTRTDLKMKIKPHALSHTC